MIAAAANKYRETEITAAELTSYASSNGGVAAGDTPTRASIVWMLYDAFGSVMPEHIGARRVMGNKDFSIDNMRDVASTDAIYTPLKWLSDLEIWVQSNSIFFQATTAVSESDLSTLISRFHTYIGTSLKDDFYATVNNEWLFENEEWKDETAPLLDTNGDGVYDGEYIADSRMIPQSGINAWAQQTSENLMAEGSNVDNYLSTYYDQTYRVKGDLCGLADMFNSIYSVTSIAELGKVMKDMIVEYGFCPLWRELSTQILGDSTTGVYTHKTQVTCYSASGTASEFAKGGSSYDSSVTQWTDNFSGIYDLTAEQASELGVNYTLFKSAYLAKYNSYETSTNSFYTGTYEYFGNPDYSYDYSDTSKATRPGYDTGYTNDYGFCLAALLEDIGCKANETTKDGEEAYWYWETYMEIQPILELWSDANLDLLKGWMAYELASYHTYCLPDDEVGNWYRVSGYNTTVEGLNDENYYTSAALPFIKGELLTTYVKTDEYAANLAQMQTVLSGLKSEYKEMLNAEDWLSDTSKENAVKKIDNMASVLFLSYDRDADGVIDGNFTDDENFVITPTYTSSSTAKLMDNVGAYNKAALSQSLSLQGTPFDSDMDIVDYAALTDPLLANAYYVPSMNGFNLTMGYAASYSEFAEDGSEITLDEMSQEKVWATFGYVTGHEISHGFDSNGVAYDYQGNSNTIFSSDDTKTYERRVRSLRNFYNGYEVMPGQATVGSAVITEATADVTGLKVAMANLTSQANYDLSEFFTAVGEEMGFITTQYIYEAAYASDSHPVGRVRANRLLQTVSEFYETFSITEGDDMYVDPDDIPEVW